MAEPVYRAALQSSGIDHSGVQGSLLPNYRHHQHSAVVWRKKKGKVVETAGLGEKKETLRRELEGKQQQESRSEEKKKKLKKLKKEERAS